MAYRRSIAARAKFFYQQQQRFSPSVSSIHREDNDSDESRTRPISRYPQAPSYIQHPFHVAGDHFTNRRRPTGLLQDRRFAVPAGCGMSYVRNYSSAGFGEGASDNIGVLNDVVGVLGDTAVEAAPVVNEVAVAAADSYAPVAALQYIIDYVHCFTGLNW